MLASAMALDLMEIRRDIRRTAALLNTKVPDGVDVFFSVSNLFFIFAASVVRWEFTVSPSPPKIQTVSKPLKARRIIGSQKYHAVNFNWPKAPNLTFAQMYLFSL